MAWWASWMFQNFIASALLALGVGALCRWKKLGPAAQHALWMVVLLKFLVPPGVAWPVSVSSAGREAAVTSHQQSAGPMGWLQALLALEAVDKEEGSANSGARGTAAGGMAARGDSAGSGRTAVGEPLPAVESPRQAATVAERHIVSGWKLSVRRITGGVLVMWVLWGLAFLALQFARIARMAWKLRHALRADPVLARQVDAAARHLGMRPIRALVVPGIQTPCIWGFFGPVLLWPQEMNRKRATSQTLTLILHEYAHVKRRDHWVGWLELLAASLWWWNPVYWYVRGKLRENAELLCDGWVVETLPWERRAYAEALLTVCERESLWSPRRHPMIAMGVTTGTRLTLEMRIRMVMNGHVALRLSKAGLAGVMVLAALALPGWARSAKQVPEKLPFTISKETTAITSPLKADGSPDYVAALNEKYSKGVTPENNGFALWLTEVAGTGTNDVISKQAMETVLKMTGAKPTPEDAPAFVDYYNYRLKQKHLAQEEAYNGYDEIISAGLQMWTEKDHPLLAEFLKSQEKVLDKACEAVARPRWWIPVVAADGQPMWLVINTTGMFRVITQELRARATLRLKADDFDGFLRDVVSIRRLARHLESGPSYTEHTVGWAMLSLANATAAVVVGSGTLTDAQLARMSKELEASVPDPEMAGVLNGMRWYDLNILALIGTGDLDGLKEIDKERAIEGRKVHDLLASVDRQAVAWDQAFREVNKAHDDYEAALLAKDRADQKQRVDDFDGKLRQWRMETGGNLALRGQEAQEAYTERVAHRIAVELIPLPRTATGLLQLMRRDRVTEDMLRMLLAAAQNNARTGSWLTNFSELEAKSPKDPFSPDGQAPFHLIASDKGVRIYSVGVNGVDDGGKFDPASKADDLSIGPR